MPADLLQLGKVYLHQGSATYNPRAECGPPRYFTRLATFYCHSARDFVSFFNDRYAALNRRNDSHLLAKTFLLWSSPPIRPKKRPEFLAKTFLVFAINSAEKSPEFLAKTFFYWSSPVILSKKRPEFLAKSFLFWSAGMVAAR